MNKPQFNFTISWTQTTSPCNWSLDEMSKQLPRIRDQAHTAEFELIEQQLQKNGLNQAKSIIEQIINRYDSRK